MGDGLAVLDQSFMDSAAPATTACSKEAWSGIRYYSGCCRSGHLRARITCLQRSARAHRI